MTDEVAALTPEREPDGALALELYASAVVATRWVYRRLAAHEPPLAELEHVADCIANAAPNPALTIALALAPSDRGDAARAVQSAFLAVRIARRAVDADSDLPRVALAALLVDAGRTRLAAASAIDLDVFSELPDSLDALAPAATAALGIGAAGSASREAAALTAFEVAWLERPRLGPAYQGKLPPRLLARVLVACRALLAKVAPASRADALSPFHAMRELCSKPGADALALRLLADTVGHIPAGTVVELESGAWGVVGPEPSRDPRRPVVWGLVDARGRFQDPPPRLDQAAVSRAIAPKEGRFNPAFALVVPRQAPSK